MPRHTEADLRPGLPGVGLAGPPVGEYVREDGYRRRSFGAEREAPVACRRAGQRPEALPATTGSPGRALAGGSIVIALS